MLDELAIARVDGRFARLTAAWARIDVLVIDDFALRPLTPDQAADTLEVIEDRAGLRVDHLHQPAADRQLARGARRADHRRRGHGPGRGRTCTASNSGASPCARKSRTPRLGPTHRRQQNLRRANAREIPNPRHTRAPSARHHTVRGKLPTRERQGGELQGITQTRTSAAMRPPMPRLPEVYENSGPGVRKRRNRQITVKPPMKQGHAAIVVDGDGGRVLLSLSAGPNVSCGDFCILRSDRCGFDNRRRFALALQPSLHSWGALRWLLVPVARCERAFPFGRDDQMALTDALGGSANHRHSSDSPRKGLVGDNRDG